MGREDRRGVSGREGIQTRRSVSVCVCGVWAGRADIGVLRGRVIQVPSCMI